jgi:hypothetical protein
LITGVSAADSNNSRVESVKHDSIDSVRHHARVVCIANEFLLRCKCAQNSLRHSVAIDSLLL